MPGILPYKRTCLLLLGAAPLLLGATDYKPRIKADAPSIPHGVHVTTNQGISVDIELMSGDEVFGGLAPGSQVKVTAPAHGKIAGWTGDTVVYRPDDIFTGDDEFTYRFTDSGGTTYTAKVTVTVRGFQDPTAVTNTVTVTAGKDRALTVADFVLLDVDPKNPGKPLVPEVFAASEPGHGKLEHNPDGSYTYRADADFAGTDSIPYTALSQEGKLISGTLALNVQRAAAPAQNQAASPPSKPAPPAPPLAAAPGAVLTARSDLLVTLGPPGCPIAIAGQDVWEVGRARTTGVTLDGLYTRGRRALSPDGKWFAAVADRGEGFSSPVVVWSTRTGRTVGADRGGHAQLIGVCWAQKWVLTAEKKGNAVDVWDLESGQRLRAIEVPRHVRWDLATLSDDGRYLAVPALGDVIAYDAATGLKVAAMNTPALPGRAGKTAPDRADPLAMDLALAWSHGLRFSPDASLLACYLTQPDTRMICWDLHGQVVLNQPVDVKVVFAENDGLEWSPDAAAWLLDKSQLCDRATFRVTRLLELPRSSDQHPAHFLDADHLLAPHGGKNFQTSYILIPVPHGAPSAPGVTPGVTSGAAPARGVKAP